MQRREVFKQIAAVAAGAGLSQSAITVSTVEKTDIPALAILECDQPLTLDAIDHISAKLTESLKGTPFEGVKVIVLTEGLRLSFLDAHGRHIEAQIATAPESTIPSS